MAEIVKTEVRIYVHFHRNVNDTGLIEGKYSEKKERKNPETKTKKDSQGHVC